MTQEIQASSVIGALASRAGDTGELRQALSEIWGSVAADLKPEEAATVLWCVCPMAFSLGSPGHRAARLNFAEALYPSEAPGRAVNRLRSVMRRPCVRATVDALRAEETLYKLAQRDQVRDRLWAIANSEPPGGSEPKDIIAHQKVVLAAMDRLAKLDALDRRHDEPASAPEEKRDGRQKALALLGKVRDSFKRGD